ncbi:MAG: alpha/beta fold hydrolase [Alphaproteobacteria bacterium]|nr:MAG: alpha/beta fold hydrolase [Alphaproteobacteria bacterium]
MDIEHRFLPGDGCKVPAVLIQPADPRGAAVIVHGYGGNKEEQLGLGWRVAEAGLVACVIDLRGHGEHSLPLDREVGADLDAAIRFCRLFGRVVAIGHSFGGHLALFSNADYCIAISPSVKRPLSEHTQATLKNKRSYRVRPSDFETVRVIHERLPTWNPTKDIGNTLILFAEWDLPEISSGCNELKNAGAYVVQIPKSTHNDIFLVEQTFEDVRNYILEWYGKGN